MDSKDVAYIIGILLTFLLGVWNLVQSYRATRKSSFINTVTSERVKWIEKLRRDISRFLSFFSETGEKLLEQKVPQEIDRLRHVIRLRLNPDGEQDRKIEKLIAEIPTLADILQQQRLSRALEELTVATQKLLKEEWDKVKIEAEYGNIKDKRNHE